MQELTKYKPGAKTHLSKSIKVIIIIAVAALGTGAIVAAADADMIRLPGVPSSTAASADNKPMVMHIHPELSIVVDGKPLTIPANIGMSASLYKNHTLDVYGMKMPNMPSMPVMYPTHTHDTSGKIHVESNEKRDYTIGDFLSVWGMDFSGKTVKMTVDGQPAPDPNYRAHVFKDREQITLDVKSG